VTTNVKVFFASTLHLRWMPVPEHVTGPFWYTLRDMLGPAASADRKCMSPKIDAPAAALTISATATRTRPAVRRRGGQPQMTRFRRSAATSQRPARRTGFWRLGPEPNDSESMWLLPAPYSPNRSSVPA